MQQLKSELSQAIPTALANFHQLSDSQQVRLPVVKGILGVSMRYGVANGKSQAIKNLQTYRENDYI